MGIKNIVNMNKKGLEFKLALFAIVGLSMIMIAVTFMLSSWNENYGVGLSPNLEEFNKLDELTDVASQQQSSIAPQSSDPGSDFEARSFRGGFGIINSIFASFSVLFGSGGMIDSAGQRFGVPTFISQGIIVMITIAIVMGIIAIIFRLNRTTA